MTQMLTVVRLENAQGHCRYARNGPAVKSRIREGLGCSGVGVHRFCPLEAGKRMHVRSTVRCRTDFEEALRPDAAGHVASLEGNDR